MSVGDRGIYNNQVKVKLVEAKSLLAGDVNGKSDPYCVFTTKSGSQTMKSKVVHSSLNPVWNEDLLLDIVDEKDTIKIDVYDHDAVGRDDFLGSTGDISLDAVEITSVNNVDKDVWLTLHHPTHKQVGSVHVVLRLLLGQPRLQERMNEEVQQILKEEHKQ